MHQPRLFPRPAALLAAFLLFPAFSAAQERRLEGNAAPLNPRYLEYRANLLQGRIQTEAGGHSLGYIPSTVDLSYLNSIPFSLEDVAGAAPLPAKYDLRTLGRLTPVRDQGNCGSCWTFATMGSAESSLMPAEPRTFSENNLKDLQGRDASPCTGGNALKSTAYFARWSGPVNESDDPYSPTDTNTSPAYTTPQKHFQDELMLAGKTNPTDNDNIKQAVMTYGAVFITVFWDNANYNSTNHSYNYMVSGSDAVKSSNHAVAIVGWDDNYDRNLFTNPPSGNGAFIVRNSWGTSWGEAGYFYLSYYDSEAATNAVFSFYGLELTSNWSRVYQYDPYGWLVNYGYSSDTAWFGNVFTAQDTESIGAVGFYAAAPNAPYTVNIYTGVTDVPTSGTLAGTTTGTLLTAGYHTVHLAAPVPVTPGTRFAAVVKIQAPGATHPIAIQYAVAGEYSNATSKPGESYTSSDGSKWNDLTNWNSTANVCLKAFTSKTSGSLSVTIASNPPGQTVTIDGTDYPAPKVFSWAAGTSHTVATNTTQGSGTTRYVFSNWSDGGDQSHTLQITQAGVFTANFTTQYKLTTAASPTAGGSISASPTSTDGFYATGTSVQLTPRPTSGNVFDSWSGGLTGSANPATVTLSQALAVTAVFRSSSAITVATSPAGLNIVVDGTTYTAPHNFTWTVNTAHVINAPSPQGTGTRYVFASWSDHGTQSHSVTPTTGGVTYTATFNPQYLLTRQSTPSSGGSITATPSSTDGYYATGTSVSLKATAATGYTFSQWTGGLSGTTNPQSLTMSAPRTVAAAFGAVSASLANDETTGATAVGSLPYSKSENTAGATANSKDPNHSCTGAQDSRTVWFKLTPDFTGVANITTINSNYDTVLSVYPTDMSSELACNDDANELTVTSAVSVGVTNGTPILVEVSAYGANGIGGTLALNITGQVLPAAANDDISVPFVIASLPSSFSEVTRAATTDPTDPYHTCTGYQDGTSVWFYYVPTYTGTLRINTIGSDYDTVLTGYSGVTGDELACNDDIDDSTYTSEIRFPVTAGVPYYLEVSSWNGGPGGLLVLNSMSEDVPPDNDSIDYPLPIMTLPFTIQESTVDATEDYYWDPWHTCTGDWDLRTVWFYYTATFTGTVHMNTFGSDYDTVLSVYDGNTGDELACNDDAGGDTYQSALDLSVSTGNSYWIEVSEYNDEYATGGTLYLNLVSASGASSSAAAQVTAAAPGSPSHCCGKGESVPSVVSAGKVRREVRPASVMQLRKTKPAAIRPARRHAARDSAPRVDVRRLLRLPPAAAPRIRP